jgi:hypothetical protein
MSLLFPYVFVWALGCCRVFFAQFSSTGLNLDLFGNIKTLNIKTSPMKVSDTGDFF